MPTNQNWDQEVYDKYHKLACKLASDFSKKYRISYEDFKSEAEFALQNVILLGKWKTVYQEKKGAGSTWMYQRIYWKLKDFVIAEAKEKAVPFTVLNAEGVEVPDKDRGHSWVEKICMEVSEEAKVMIKAIMSAPKEIIEDERKSRKWMKDLYSKTPKQARAMVRDYMVNEKDLSVFKFNLISNEIASCL